MGYGLATNKLYETAEVETNDMGKMHTTTRQLVLLLPGNVFVAVRRCLLCSMTTMHLESILPGVRSC